MARKWLSAHDNRARDWHAALDGVTKPIDEPFENEFGKIMRPGDPAAHGANVYHCRCTIAAVVKGFGNRRINFGGESKEHNKAENAKKTYNKKPRSDRIKQKENKRGKYIMDKEAILIDTDTLKDNADFEHLLGYINTATGKQKKGVRGSAK